MSFSLSMNTTTLTLPPKGLMAVSRVSAGFSTTTKVQLKTTRRSGRMSLIVAQSSSNNGPDSVEVEYYSVLKDLEPRSVKCVEAVTKRVSKWKEYAIAHAKAKLEWDSWGNKLLDIENLQNQLGDIVDNTSSSEDVASLKVKYDEAVNELKTLVSNSVEAGMERSLRWKDQASARIDAYYSWQNWELITANVTRLQNQLGISVEKSPSSSENDRFASLETKYKKALKEMVSARKKYLKIRAKRFEMGNIEDESEEELLAWESSEMKLLKVKERQMQMYILRPGIKF